jgi:hypothetical protein
LIHLPWGVAPDKFRQGATFFAGALEIFETAIVCFPRSEVRPVSGGGALRVVILQLTDKEEKACVTCPCPRPQFLHQSCAPRQA